MIASRIENTEREEAPRVAWGRLAWATPLAVIVAVAGTLAVYGVASAIGLGDERVVLPSLIGMGPLTSASVSVTALVAVLGASILLGLLAATTRRPVRIFRIVASVLAVASLSMPATIPGPSGGMRLTLVAMHVVVWAVSVGVLSTLASQRVKAAA